MHDPEHDFLDAELSKILNDEGGMPEPSEEYFERLRQEIKSRTKPFHGKHSASTPEQTEASPLVAQVGPAKASRFYLRMSIIAAASVLFLCMLTMCSFMQSASASLRNSLDATRAALWIHGSTTILNTGYSNAGFANAGVSNNENADAADSFKAESWCNPVDRLFAFKSPQMAFIVDYEQGLQTSYSKEQGKIFQWLADGRNENFGRAFVLALLNDGDIQSSYPLHHVSDVRKVDSDVDGEPVAEFSFQVQDKSNPSIRWETTIATSFKSGRIISWKDRHAGGLQVMTRFDYPNNGPRTIYDLGAPDESEVSHLFVP